MSLDDAARRGKEREAARELAAVQATKDRAEALDAEQRTRLDRVYGLDANLTWFGVYMLVMAVVIFAVFQLVLRTNAHPKPGAASMGWITSGILAVIGLLAVAGGLRVPSARAAEETWLRTRPFPFDHAPYRASLIEFDRMRGRVWVTVQVESALDPELAEKLRLAAIGSSAEYASWSENRRTLGIRSAERDTWVRGKNVSYKTAHGLHRWFRRFSEEALEPMSRVAKITKVTALAQP